MQQTAVFEENGHTHACNEQRALDQALFDAYAAQWPCFCRACRASGSRYDPGTYFDPPGYDECLRCVGKGLCPRCGRTESLDEEGMRCLACGWNAESSAGFAPLDPRQEECACFFLSLKDDAPDLRSWDPVL
jgi:hypothetical protein